MNLVETEQHILGSVLIDRSVKHLVIPMLKEGMFTVQKHKDIYRAMSQLLENDTAIDAITLLDRMEANGTREQQDAHYMTELTYKLATSANTEHHVKILTENWMRREVSAMANDYAYRLQDVSNDVFTTMESFINELSKYNEQTAIGSNKPVSIVADAVYREALEAKSSDNHIAGFASGFYDLDTLTNGFKAPQLVIIAARPAMGKTSMVINLASNYSFDDVPVGIFSLEMSAEELVKKLISMESGVSTQDIERGYFDDISHSVKKVKGHQIYINDSAGMTPSEIQVSARKMQSQFGVKVVIVDYIQLMHSGKKHGNREQEVSEISRSLKKIAKNLSVPVIALSQLSRKCEDRSDKRPMLSDLRESGAIEQDADIVAFLYRPAYYGITENENQDDISDVTEFIIAKQRNGNRGTVYLSFDSLTTKFKTHEQARIF